jgi:hypothetical protein
VSLEGVNAWVGKLRLPAALRQTLTCTGQRRRGAFFHGFMHLFGASGNSIVVDPLHLAPLESGYLGLLRSAAINLVDIARHTRTLMRHALSVHPGLFSFSDTGISRINSLHSH